MMVCSGNSPTVSSGSGLGTGSKSRSGRVRFSSEVAPPPREQLSIGSRGTNSDRTSTGGEHLVDVDTESPGVRFYSSSDDEVEASATTSLDYRKLRGRSPFIDAASVFRDDSERNLQYHSEEAEHKYGYDELGGGDRDGDGTGESDGKKKKKESNAPEQKITIFALRLALIEKSASGLGTLSFLWATVVILGGFATTVNETDFWVVTLIILAESSRIFSRSHELEWQQLSVRSSESLTHRFFRAASTSYERKIKSCFHSLVSREGELGGREAAAATAGGGASSHRPPNPARRRNRGNIRLESESKDQTRTWNARYLQLVPYTHHLVTTQLVSRLLYIVQLLSAMMSIGLAIWRLLNQDFYHSSDSGQKPPNITVSMNVFYILSVVEAGLFLVERIYWEYRIRVTELLQNVNKEAELGPENLLTVKQFFFEVYSQCLKGSVFDGLDMDLVSFSISWLQADGFKQQLGGARLLNGIITTDDGKARKNNFAADCLRRLGTSPGTIERLVEMLSWNSEQEEPLLSEVAAIICRLVVYNRNCSRIVGIPGSIEGIMNLLLPHEWPNPQDKDYEQRVESYLQLRVNGLRILKYLCKDHKNCLRIGETKGLLSILILFIEVRNEKAFDETSSADKKLFVHQLKTFKKSLQVIGLLAAATNTSGGLLRRRIADVVSGLKNLRDIIEFGDSQPGLQRSSADILYHLAMEPDVRKTIGATGGTIRNLYNLFASYDDVNYSRSSHPTVIPADPEERKKREEQRQRASEMAGKTLSRIVLQNPRNCLKVVSMRSEKDEPFLRCMVRFLSKPLETENPSSRLLASCSAQILRSVMFHTDDRVRKQVAEDSARLVLQQMQRRIHEGRSSLYESYLGLASRIIEPLSHETYSQLFATIISKKDLVKQLLNNLKHTPSTNRYPRIRRYSVELLIVLSDKDAQLYQSGKADITRKDDCFVNIVRSRSFNVFEVLQSTLDSISEVENFCLFSGLVGYARHEEDMEKLVVRAIQHIQSVDRDNKSHYP